MKSDSIFREYIWLLNIISRAGKISYKDINRRWQDNRNLSDGNPLSRTTFNRHRAAIANMFGLEIKCDASDGYTYYIDNIGDLGDDSIQKWMLSTLSVNNLLSSCQNISYRILLDPIPSDGENLHSLIEAMKSNLRVKLSYRKYGSDYENVMTVDPLFVKLFNKRWYVIVRKPDVGFIFPLALDRIICLQTTSEQFVFPEDFSPSLYMKDQYGVVIDEDIEVSRVVIRAFGKEADYLRDLPLHHSQQVIGVQEEWTDFELHIRITYDFLTPLLSKGPNIQVLEPSYLADELANLHYSSLRIYETEEDNIE